MPEQLAAAEVCDETGGEVRSAAGYIKITVHFTLHAK